jgi:hypothetical protein
LGTSCKMVVAMPDTVHSADEADVSKPFSRKPAGLGSELHSDVNVVLAGCPRSPVQRLEADVAARR